MNCGLLGQTLGHSYSPQIHALLGKYTYDLFEVEPENLSIFFQNGNFTGINVTIPYKKQVIEYCTTLSPIAKKLGAVNTILRQQDGTYFGHNTDYFGFKSMVNRSGLSVSCKKVLVLGSGGASATAVAVLEEMGANVVIVSRNGNNHYGNLHQHSDASVIVNTTPVGMYPNTGITPINIDLFPNLEGVLDLIYNPAKTALILAAEDRGLVAMNGLWMLVAQAKESAQWFMGKTIDDNMIQKIHDKLKYQMGNLVLIGMPGSGKSTIGKMLAKRLCRKFVDTDMAIVEKMHTSIPDIFSKIGASGFREIESNVLQDLGKQSGLVIATGGGCVTVEANKAHLRQNGRIVWLKRDPHHLPTDGRPLSQTGNLEEMYHVRRPLYESFADYSVSNDQPSECTVADILSIIGETP